MTETVPALLDELAGLGDPKMLAVNQRHGDEHSVNLTKLRAVEKRVKTNQPLALELWETENTNARLLALLVCKPKEFTQEQLDTMLRDARTPKVQDWLVNYVVKKSNHKENLREVWFADADPVVASAGWALTTERVIKSPDGIDLVGLLDLIESDMKDAQSRLQWAMNETLANIGIYHEDLRARALDIGERLEVLKDYPTPPNCTSPFAPIWINAIVARR
jgi:3-methyladenine DNA glycosylase AlkD